MHNVSITFLSSSEDCSQCPITVLCCTLNHAIKTGPTVLHSAIICFREYATDVNVLVARKAIQAMGKIALRVSARANTCADKLVSLLAMEIDYVTAETLVSLASEYSFICEGCSITCIIHVHCMLPSSNSQGCVCVPQ